MATDGAARSADPGEAIAKRFSISPRRFGRLLEKFTELVELLFGEPAQFRRAGGGTVNGGSLRPRL
jgi:hypothetical protein